MSSTAAAAAAFALCRRGSASVLRSAQVIGAGGPSGVQPAAGSLWVSHPLSASAMAGRLGPATHGFACSSGYSTEAGEVAVGEAKEPFYPTRNKRRYWRMEARRVDREERAARRKEQTKANKAGKIEKRREHWKAMAALWGGKVEQGSQ